MEYEDLGDEELEAAIEEAKASVALGSPTRFVWSFVNALRDGRLDDAELCLSPSCDLRDVAGIADVPFVRSGDWSILSRTERWEDGRLVVLVLSAERRGDGAPHLYAPDEPLPPTLEVVVSHSDAVGWSVDGLKDTVLADAAFMAPGAPGRLVAEWAEAFADQLVRLPWALAGRWRVLRQRGGAELLTPNRQEVWLADADARVLAGEPIEGLRFTVAFSDEDGWKIDHVGPTPANS